MQWEHPQRGTIQIALMLRELPRPVIGWDGETLRCEWALVSDAEHRWTHKVMCPALGLGLLGGPSRQLRDQSSVRKHLREDRTGPLPVVQTLPIEELTRDRQQQLLARITAPDRTEGILVATMEAGGQFTGGMLSDDAIFVWPGLMSLVVVSQEGQSPNLIRLLTDAHAEADRHAVASEQAEDELTVAVRARDHLARLLAHIASPVRNRPTTLTRKCPPTSAPS